MLSPPIQTWSSFLALITQVPLLELDNNINRSSHLHNMTTALTINNWPPTCSIHLISLLHNSIKSHQPIKVTPFASNSQFHSQGGSASLQISHSISLRLNFRKGWNSDTRSLVRSFYLVYINLNYAQPPSSHPSIHHPIHRLIPPEFLHLPISTSSRFNPSGHRESASDLHSVRGPCAHNQCSADTPELIPDSAKPQCGSFDSERLK